MSKFYLLEVVANVAPSGAAIAFSDTLEEQRQDAQEHVCVDSVRSPVEDRPHPESALQCAPRFLNSHELLIAEREVLSVERVIVAVDDELAVGLLGSADSASPAAGLP